MVQFRKDTSFPFLKIAREYNIPYSQVLEWADTHEKGKTIVVQAKHYDAVNAVMQAAVQESIRRGHSQMSLINLRLVS